MEVQVINIKGVKTNVEGENNTISAEEIKPKNVTFDIIGNNNVIDVGQNTFLRNTKIDIRGKNNKVIIGEKCKLKGGYLLIKGNNQTISIGNKTTMGHELYILAQEGKNITIGEDCMFSYRITLRTTDAHSLIDATTGERLNQAKDINIGNHVWVAADVLMSKGVSIANNCVIGARAVITKNFEKEHCAIGGVPAKVIKENVNWRRDLI